MTWWKLRVKCVGLRERTWCPILSLRKCPPGSSVGLWKLENGHYRSKATRNLYRYPRFVQYKVWWMKIVWSRHPALNKAFHPAETYRPEWPYRVGDFTRVAEKEIVRECFEWPAIVICNLTLFCLSREWWWERKWERKELTSIRPKKPVQSFLLLEAMRRGNCLSDGVFKWIKRGISTISLIFNKKNPGVFSNKSQRFGCPIQHINGKVPTEYFCFPIKTENYVAECL